MKKSLLFSSVLLMSVYFVNAQTGKLGLPNTVHPLQKNLKTNEPSFLTTPSQGSLFKKNPSVMAGRLVGYTCYDLQTNASVGKRIINHGDGTFSFVWTIDDACAAGFANRGSGYNYWNGTALLYPTGTTARIETIRTGFSHIALLGNGNEVIFAHKGPPYDFQMSTSPKGTGTWTGVAAGATSMLPGGADQGLWNRMATGGSDGNSIHLVAGYFSGVQMGITTPFTYSRSTDAGQSWDIQSINLPGYDSTRTLTGSAENYVIDAQDSTVAIAQGGIDGDVFLWKSTDNGSTFSTTFVDSFLFAPSIDITGTPTDTAVTCDGGLDVVIDPTGKVHVAFSTVRVVVGGYFPTDVGLVYWNDVAQTQVNIPITMADVDGTINGGNNNGTYDVGAANVLIDATGIPPNARYGNKAYLSIPSIAVEGDNVFIVFSLITDGDMNPAPDERSFRDIWVVASKDGGVTFDPIQNITCTPLEEEYFGSLAKRVDNYLHILYQLDAEPGTNLQNGHPIASAEIAWAVIDKAAVLAGTAHCSFSGLGVNEQTTPAFNVADAYPNPTSGITSFDVIVKQSGNIALNVYNNLGQIVYSSENNFSAGKHILKLDASSFATGLYFYTIKSGSSSVNGKFVKE